MIQVRDQWCIQIEVTNACPRKCSNCTRMLAHVKHPFFMSTDFFRKAVESLQDYPGVVGVMGGEPTIHPRFLELVDIIEVLRPDRSKRGLWTSLGAVYEKHKKRIDEVFGVQNINPHDESNRKRYGTQVVKHQPVLVASKDLIPDKETRWKWINECWVQRIWSSSITPKGAFFCEIAAAFDMVFGGPGGKPVEPGWWQRDLSYFQDQIDRWCDMCGAALPLPARLDHEEIDDITESNLRKLMDLQSPRVLADKVHLFDVFNYDPNCYIDSWTPNQYLRK